MRFVIVLGGLAALLYSTAQAAEPPRCVGAIGACFRIEGSLSLVPNTGFILEIEGTRAFTLSRHAPPANISEIIGLDLSAHIAGLYNVCPIRNDTTQAGHRHLYCVEDVTNIVVTPSGSAKPALCKSYKCTK
jgi:hypothetical protein